MVARMPAHRDTAPRHIAIIMDGNGRWARERHLPRIAGHQAGAKNVRRVVEAGIGLGVDILTLYAFSTENWRRPEAEVTALMALIAQFMRQEAGEMKRKGVRLQILGRRAPLPEDLQSLADWAERETAGGQRLLLNLGINYGSHTEMVDATRALVCAVHEKEVSPDQIDEVTFSEYLYTSGLPDPEICIRTGGEMRLSNFLLWQLAQAYFWSTPVFWPDFDGATLSQAVQAWQKDRKDDEKT